MSKPTSKCPMSHLTTSFGAPVSTNRDSLTAGPRGPLLAQDVWLNEKLAGFVREVIPERRMHAKGSGAFGPSLSPKTSPSTPALNCFPKWAKKPRCLPALPQLRVSVAQPMPSAIFVVLP